ncbi:MAG: hypothetical protein AAF410_03455 [Pseudomonadota bacterium]
MKKKRTLKRIRRPRVKGDITASSTISNNEDKQQVINEAVARVREKRKNKAESEK